MWALRNKTPYAAERNWTRDKEGVHWWLVAIRATFQIDAAGKLRLADEQPPPVLVPEHFGAPGASSLRYDSDLLRVKPTTDVLVLGSAYAPRGRPATSVPVVLRAADLEKHLVVFGERVYYNGVSGMTTTAPRPFTVQPIRYEYAYGGGDVDDPDLSRHRIDERNPVGRGFAARSSALINTVAHTIEHARGNPAKAGPAGFGPIDAGWLPRRKLAGTYDAKWVETKKPLLPEDYQSTFALSAPADQRVARPLVGGEKVGLYNMSPHGTLVFELPRIELRCSSFFGGSPTPHAPPLLATVLIEPDESKMSLIWQSGLRVEASDCDYLDTTLIEERASA